METKVQEKDPFDYLLEVVKQKGENLKSLNLFYCVSSEEESEESFRGRGYYDRYGFYDSSSESGEGRSDIVYTFPKKLAGMESLENLELSTSEINKSLLGHMLLSMKSLKEFTLNLYAFSGSKPWDEDFPFAGLVHIKEFKLVIHSDAKELLWGKNLVRKLSKFEHLEAIEIVDYTKTEMSLSIFCGFMAALCKLKVLKRVVLKTKVSKERHYDDTEQFLPEEARLCFKEGRKAILEGIKNYVKYLVESIETMEEINIRKIKSYNIEKIYKKKKKNNEIDLTRSIQ